MQYMIHLPGQKPGGVSIREGAPNRINIVHVRNSYQFLLLLFTVLYYHVDLLYGRCSYVIDIFNDLVF